MTDITDRKLVINFGEELVSSCDITEATLDEAVLQLEQSYAVVAWWQANETKWGLTYSIHALRQQMSDEDAIREGLQRIQHRLINGEVEE